MTREYPSRGKKKESKNNMIKVKIECQDCSTTNDYEGDGCIVIVFSDTGVPQIAGIDVIEHHVDEGEAILALVKLLAKYLIQKGPLTQDDVDLINSALTQPLPFPEFMKLKGMTDEPE